MAHHQLITKKKIKFPVTVLTFTNKRPNGACFFFFLNLSALSVQNHLQIETPFLLYQHHDILLHLVHQAGGGEVNHGKSTN